ncbi:MAG: alginate lyase family protein [Deltaproteobacteria bacterium]|nr:alginate lyase family protein [Deltaproteobacteria bacterium]
MGLRAAMVVAGAVPPQALAGAVVRRTLGALRRARNRLLPPVDDAGLLGAFGARDVAELTQVLARPRLAAHWSDAGRAEALRVISQRDPDFRDRVLARAQSIVDGELEVFGRRIRFPDQHVRWCADPIAGVAFPARGRPSLLRAGRGDPKRVWALSRMDWAVALAQGAWLAEPERGQTFTSTFVALADSFFREVPPGEGIHAASPMEVSLRAMNLALALCMMRARLDDGAFLLRALRHLAESARFVHANLEDGGAVPNNHLVADCVGLLHVALFFPELPGASDWRGVALTRLANEVPAQVLPDGMGFEASTGYHRLLLELVLAAFLISRAAGDSLAAELAPTLHRMFLAARCVLHADGSAPQIGDSDSGRALALADRAPLEHGYLPALGAALFHDARLQAPDAQLPDEARWLLDRAELEGFHTLAPTSQGSASLPDFGLAVLRRGETTLTLRAGPTGQRGVGGHGHNDQLAITLHHGDAPLIVDPGTWSYLGDPAGRDRFRSTAMHATVQVDGLEQSPLLEGRPFALPDLAGGRLVRVERGESVERAEAKHVGFLPVHVRRTVWLAEAAALVVDDVRGPGVHRLVSRFPLANEEARIRPLNEAERARLAQLPQHARWDVARGVELGPVDAPRAIWVAPEGGTLHLAESAYSPGYDERIPTLCIELELHVVLPVRLAAAVLILTTRGGRPTCA